MPVVDDHVPRGVAVGPAGAPSARRPATRRRVAARERGIAASARSSCVDPLGGRGSGPRPTGYERHASERRRPDLRSPADAEIGRGTKVFDARRSQGRCGSWGPRRRARPDGHRRRRGHRAGPRRRRHVPRAAVPRARRRSCARAARLRSHIGIVSREFQVPCVDGASTFADGEPADGVDRRARLLGRARASSVADDDAVDARPTGSSSTTRRSPRRSPTSARRSSRGSSR